MRMMKQTVVKDDGRRLIYYRFTEARGIKGSRDQGIESGHLNP